MTRDVDSGGGDDMTVEQLSEKVASARFADIAASRAPRRAGAVETGSETGFGSTLAAGLAANPLTYLASPRDVKSNHWRGFPRDLPPDPRLIRQPFSGIPQPCANEPPPYGSTRRLLHRLAVLEAGIAQHLPPLLHLDAEDAGNRHHLGLEVVERLELGLGPAARDPALVEHHLLQRHALELLCALRCQRT